MVKCQMTQTGGCLYVLIYEVKGWLQLTPTDLERPYLNP